MTRYIRFNKLTRKPKGQVEWEDAPDIKKTVETLVDSIQPENYEKDRLFFFRSKNSSAYAYARIWGLSKVWQKALKIKPAYIIEVISEKFDSLGEMEKKKVLLHELAHIPKNFSGSLLPHTKKRGKRNFEDRVHKLFSEYMRKLK